MNFLDFDLSATINKAKTEIGYETPAHIQQKSIPVILDRRDMLSHTQAGTDKTTFFAIPIFATQMKKPDLNNI